MTSAQSTLFPIAAREHSASRHRPVGSAATMLIIYVVLLVGFPSFATISGLGGLGRPSLLWGLFLMFWWLLSRLQMRSHATQPVWQPVRLAFAALIVIVLLSSAAAMLRGQPADQISPATTALLRMASSAGVLLVAMDGLRTHVDAARLVRTLAWAGGSLAALGLAQFFTGDSLLGWISNVPGVAMDVGDIATRGAYTRASGTATHPLEYGTVIVACLPFAIAAAVNNGFHSPRSRYAGWWWLPVVLMTAASVVAVSRSTLVGLAVAVVTSLPAVPRVLRWVIAIGGAILTAAVLAVVPGMMGTIVSLFAGASDDPSTQSRANALARVPEFISSSPIIGQGFGTFLPRYYIFDNAWVLLTVELGIVGIVTFGALILAAIGSAIWASRETPFDDTRAMGIATASSITTIAILLLFFDGLSFPMSTGLFFVIIGLAAALRTIAHADMIAAGSGSVDSLPSRDH